MKRYAGIVVALLLVLAVGSGCQKIGAVTSSVSPCFKAIPPARDAVGGQGTLVDVARVSRSALPLPRINRLPLGGVRRQTPPSTDLASQREVCLVAYRGTFDPNRIAHLAGTSRTGRYAVVVVGIRTQKVHLVMLVDELPRPLHH